MAGGRWRGIGRKAAASSAVRPIRAGPVSAVRPAREAGATGVPPRLERAANRASIGPAGEVLRAAVQSGAVRIRFRGLGGGRVGGFPRLCGEAEPFILQLRY
ncbi:hypothetical protein PS9374_01440 [Planomonospora sphaerica]|uniref:Uncharacterized protein n=1 Tax=Planomonospora sphaerica TaxID=161355 RepID=A0A161LME6_9ACTN|nr:hypothetical protein PS9374_01440 [Planomonospora sphaerica]